jgi:hypothetical protein
MYVCMDMCVFMYGCVHVCVCGTGTTRVTCVKKETSRFIALCDIIQKKKIFCARERHHMDTKICASSAQTQAANNGSIPSQVDSAPREYIASMQHAKSNMKHTCRLWQAYYYEDAQMHAPAHTGAASCASVRNSQHLQRFPYIHERCHYMLTSKNVSSTGSSMVQPSGRRETYCWEKPLQCSRCREIESFYSVLSRFIFPSHIFRKPATTYTRVSVNHLIHDASILKYPLAACAYLHGPCMTNAAYASF